MASAKSAITEYIHYHQKNYTDWGINRVDTEKSQDFSVSINAVHKKMLDKKDINILISQAKNIEEEYNNLLFSKNETVFSEALRQAAQQTLIEEFGLKAGQIDQNFNINETDIAKQYQEKIRDTKQKVRINYLKKTDSIKVFRNRIDKILTTLLPENDSLFGETSSKMQERIKIAREELEGILREIKGLTKEQIAQEDWEKNIQSVNKIINQFNRNFTYWGERGFLFEWLLPLIKLKGSNLGKDELKKAMKELSKASNIGGGSHDIKIILSENNDKDVTVSDFSIKENDIEVTIKNVRNKVDVIISLPVEGKEKNINVSAKSTTTSNLKIVEDTTLYRILLFSQNINFIKHYLNIVSCSKDGEQRAPEEDIIQANKTVMALIMRLGLEGFDKNNLAELFIIHDATSQKIKVYNIKVLIYNIQKMLVDNGQKYQGITISGLDENYTISQEMEETVGERLYFLLNKTQNQKITAHLTLNVLDFLHSQNF